MIVAVSIDLRPHIGYSKKNTKNENKTLNLLRWGQTYSDWENIKSHGSPHIGEHFGDKMEGI